MKEMCEAWRELIKTLEENMDGNIYKLRSQNDSFIFPPKNYIYVKIGLNRPLAMTDSN